MARAVGLGVVIAGIARTPVGSFLGSLASVKAPELGAIAIQGALANASKTHSGLAGRYRTQFALGLDVPLEAVEECLMGNVVGAGVGQAPARQAALLAGLSERTVCTTVNKVCSSGLKAVTLGAQSIQLGHSKVVVAGGMESMSQTPFYIDASIRRGVPLGGAGGSGPALVDGIIQDGLWDPKHKMHMGKCAESVAKKYGITREAQDQHARLSYERAAKATMAGWFKKEIVPVLVKSKRETKSISEDEEYKRIDFGKMGTLRPAFMKEEEGGTITAANASSLSDGSSAVVLALENSSELKHLKPLARILSYADAERAPLDFSIAPALAIPLALNRAGLSIADISLFEINEAFSAVILANQHILDLDPEKVNIAGGAVAMGHPIGSSGSRILVTLTSLLKSGQFGVAAICNGGGGSTAVVIERL